LLGQRDFINEIHLKTSGNAKGAGRGCAEIISLTRAMQGGPGDERK
jgi:hypothetical protein